jgi:hypothetical protein
MQTNLQERQKDAYVELDVPYQTLLHERYRGLQDFATFMISTKFMPT